MNSNAVAGGNPIYLVLGNTTTAAAANSITRSANFGRIISDGENNIVKWYIGNNTGVYIIPWCYSAATSYIPFTYSVTTAGTAAAPVRFSEFSTYRTGSNNLLMFPSGVTNDWSSACACNASPWMVDRMWRLDNDDYGSSAVTPDAALTFTYIDGGVGTAESQTGSLTAAMEIDLQAEAYNNNANKWVGTLYAQDVPASDYVVTGNVGSSELYKRKWWVLVEKNHPLPVQWLSVSSECIDGEVNVKWSTASEQNADHFTVERSNDGMNFSPITTLPAAGNSSTVKNYSFIDSDPLSGISYYRIRETDFNGDFMVSKQITNNGCSSDISISIYPNPAFSNTNLNVSVNGAKDSEVLIVVTDMLGQEFYSKVTVLSTDEQVIAIDPSHQLAAGVYTVVATSNDEIQKKKIVIQ